MRSSHFGHVLQRRFLLEAQEAIANPIKHAKSVFFIFDAIVSPGYTCEDKWFHDRHCALFIAFNGRLCRLDLECLSISEIPDLCCRKRLSLATGRMVWSTDLQFVYDEIQYVFLNLMAATGVNCESPVLSGRAFRVLSYPFSTGISAFDIAEITPFLIHFSLCIVRFLPVQISIAAP